MLYLIATPIGNLADLSQRALTVLQKSDLILCEDTQHSKILLKHYGLEKPLLSFHQFNEQTREEQILQKLEQGLSVALISDAGTPLISDPGASLVKACIQRGLAFTAIPGPCSLIQALLLSGFDAEQFQFIGFLPRKQEALEHVLRRAFFYRGTTIAFESPNRILASLERIASIDPNREIAIARELTKIHEECLRGSANSLISHFREHAPRGEFILLIREGTVPEEKIDVEELVQLLQELHGLSLKEAIKAAAALNNVPKKTVYQRIHRD